MDKPRQENQTDFAVRLMASIAQPVVVVDPEFRVIYWNKGADVGRRRLVRSRHPDLRFA